MINLPIHSFSLRRTIHIILTKAVLFGAALALFYGCNNNDLKKLPKGEKNVDYTKDIAENVTIIVSEKSWTKAKLDATLLITNMDAKPPYIEMPKGVKAVFFNEGGLEESNLVAKYGRYYPNTKNILLKDSVIVYNKDNNRLFTNELIWNQSTERFFSETDVYVYGNEFLIYGEGFDANKDFTEFHFKKQKGIIPIKKGAIPTP